MEHSNNSSSKEYLKFVGVLVFILITSYLYSLYIGLDLLTFLESFMGVFFVTFALFKIYKLKEFAYGFQSYDLIAQKSLVYSFAYPFIQLFFGFAYLLGYSTVALNIIVIIVSLVSGAGVIKSLLSKQMVHCVCLGGVIKLPLSRISFVEDFGMAIMALVMIFL
jgi:hypothetical protein